MHRKALHSWLETDARDRRGSRRPVHRGRKCIPNAKVGYEITPECLKRSQRGSANRRTGKEAGEAFEKAATVQRQQLNEPDDEANTLTEAFSM